MSAKAARKLKPSSGLVDATAVSVGAITGTGIYVVTGIVASLAGPALVVSMIVAAKLLIHSFFIVLGMRHMDPENFQLFIPSKAGVIYGACYIFFAFGDFARVSVIAEEVKDAEHTVPKAILLLLLISTVFYLLIGVATVGLVGASSLAGSSSPLATAMSATGNRAAVAPVSLGGLVATASVLLTAILGVSREAYAMARKDVLPATLGRLHPVHGTPYLAIWVSGALMDPDDLLREPARSSGR